MGDYTLAEVFDAVYRQEFSEFDDPPGHFFSLRHRRAMKQIFYPRNALTSAAKRKLPLKKRVIIVLLVILLSVLGIAAGAEICKSFAFEEHNSHRYLFAVNDKNAPAEIVTLYRLPAVPDGFEVFYENSDPYNAFIDYYDYSEHRSLCFLQNVKNGFNINLDNELGYLEEMKINGCPAYFLSFYDESGVIVWDNGDYILEVAGEFSKDELIAFAESVEIIEE